MSKESNLGGRVYDTPADEFTTIVRRLENAIQNKNDMTTEHASEWKEAKAKGINNKALKLTLQLKKQDASKTADFLRAFDAYCDALGVRSQTDMFEQEKANKANGESIEKASAPPPPPASEPDFAE